jgi:hypothetical protein
MIDYDSAISARDILNYWANGIVLLEHEGSWSGYRMSGIVDHPEGTAGKERIKLTLAATSLTYGKPPKSVLLTRPDFFKRAILHRPRLGVVMGNEGKMYMLSWAPGRGDLNKAIQKSDIVFKVLDTHTKGQLDDWPKRYDEMGVAWGEAMTDLRELKHWQLDYGVHRKQERTIYVRLMKRTDAIADVMPKSSSTGMLPLGKHLDLAVRYLNFKPVTIKEAYKACLDKGASVIKGTLWLCRRDKGDVVLVVNGESTIGYLSKTLQSHPVFDYKNPQRSRINRQLLSMLLEDK